MVSLISDQYDCSSYPLSHGLFAKERIVVLHFMIKEFHNMVFVELFIIYYYVRRVSMNHDERGLELIGWACLTCGFAAACAERVWSTYVRSGLNPDALFALILFAQLFRCKVYAVMPYLAAVSLD